MPHLFGRDWTKAELLRYVGDISQVARAKPYRLVEGHEDGVQAIDITTGSGFGFSVLASRGLDISSAHHRGRSLAWRSATTDQHPAYFEPEGRGWLRGFYGGLVVTCGFTWMGAPTEDGEGPHGLHGRASNLPATNVHWDGRWEGDDYVLEVSGKLREAIVFGENIQVTRRIWAKAGENRLFLNDRVENMGSARTSHMILYHINIGWPAIGDKAQLVAPSTSVTPRDDEARDGFEGHTNMQPPTRGFEEKVYFHDLIPDAEGYVKTSLVNPECEGGFGVYARWMKEELPYFTQWKMMGEGTYVCGMEPANALVTGRASEREAGRLQYLEPGEVREYTVEIGVVEG